MNEKVSALVNGLEATLLNKVKEIIEEKLGRSLEELEDLRISQFYERLINQDMVHYKPRPLYVLYATFLHASNVRQVIFSLTDEKRAGVTLLPREEFMRVVQQNPNDK